MGSSPLGTPKFLESKMAKTIMRRNMVATTWGREKMHKGFNLYSSHSPTSELTPSGEKQTW